MSYCNYKQNNQIFRWKRYYIEFRIQIENERNWFL